MRRFSPTDRAKARIRREVWSRLERLEIATTPRPCYGKIPNFVGSLNAARKITRLAAFREARVIYSTPDLPQKPIREEALRRGKVVVTALPRLNGYLLLDPAKIPRDMVSYATTVRGSLKMGRRVPVLEDVKVDLVVLGSVAAGRDGARLGKGDGRYDLEYALLRELNVIDKSTPVATTIHDVQLVEGIPMERHDVPADYVATPKELIVAEGRYEKPPGVFWELLTIDEIKASPILRRLFGIPEPA